MCVYVCVCMCVCVCMYVCVYVCMSVCVYLWSWYRLYVCSTHLHTCVCVHIQYVCTSTSCVQYICKTYACTYCVVSVCVCMCAQHLQCMSMWHIHTPTTLPNVFHGVTQWTEQERPQVGFHTALHAFYHFKFVYCSPHRTSHPTSTSHYYCVPPLFNRNL